MAPVTRLYRRKLLLSSSFALFVLAGLQLPGLFLRWSGSALDIFVLVGLLGMLALAIAALVARHRDIKRGGDDDTPPEN
ncbi:hypothetical protein ACL9RL_18675 [Plantibacter sp. Mn2098]|uniref:hypothetical protein n=1 Tax=Plantibacter sp. Mn2098 TaxID=3395266 RepID=UPI003BD2A26B